MLGQSAYIYLQPESSQDVSYDNANVQSAFGKTVPTQLTATVWPDEGEESNFRMAVPQGAHAEAQLLGQTNDGLEDMIFTGGKPCPQYVIFYSLLLPCQDCTNKIVDASKKFKNNSKCKGRPFYLYVQKPDYTKDGAFFNSIRKTLIDPQTGIIWSNDPGPRLLQILTNFAARWFSQLNNLLTIDLGTVFLRFFY